MKTHNDRDFYRGVLTAVPSQELVILIYDNEMN